MRLDEPIIVGRLQDSFGGRSVTRDQAETTRLGTRRLSVVAPVNDSLRAGGDGDPVPKANVAGTHLAATLETIAAMPALEFGHPEGFVSRIGAGNLQPCSSFIDGKHAPTREVREPPSFSQFG